MNNQIAYVDEYGNFGYDFDKKGVSTHFIVTSIIVDENKLQEVEFQLEIIRKQYFQTGEIKSSYVGSNDLRRIKILEKLSKIDFHIFSIVIDKRNLKSEGLKYKQSFFKFLHSLIDRELFKVFPDLKIVADEHGSKKFMTGFIKYIQKNHIPDLFNQADFRFSNSKSDLMVQLADFITGTFGFCFDDKRLSPIRNEFLRTLKNKIIELRFWPNNYYPFAYEPQKDFKDFDITIANLGINLAKQFIQKKENKKSPAEIDQVNCLRYLLFYFQNINPTQYVSTYELMHHINSWRANNMSIHYFRSKVIAKLRDWGVIIASCNLGYKLPSNQVDLYDYVNHSNTYIQPMIGRLIKCRNKVRLATKNRIDILDHDEFVYLKILIKYNLP